MAWTHVLFAAAGVATGFMGSILVAERSFVKLENYREDRAALGAEILLLRDVDSAARSEVSVRLDEMKRDISAMRSLQSAMAQKLGVEQRH